MKTKRERVGFTLIELLACQPKPWRRQVRAAFTLIELLVVIAILGILMAMMIPAAGLILRRAKVAQAKGDAGVAMTVMLKYRMEYNRWPDLPPDGQNRMTTDGTWVGVMSPDPLQPGEKPSEYNFKGIRFFEPSGGAIAPPDHGYPGAFVDAWGMPFQYQFGDQYGNAKHPSGEGTISAQLIVWSPGPDGNYETWEDNVTSWE